MTATAIAPAPTAQKNDFADLVNLLDKLTAAENELTIITAALNVGHLAAVREYMPKYKETQTIIGEVEAAIVVIAKRNPQWFGEKKTVETPFGLVKRTSSTALVIPDETVTITLIRAASREKDFLVTTTAIMRESLEKLEDAELAKYGVRRETTHNFNTAPAQVDLGKSVKAAEKSDKAAAKTAKKAGAS